MFVNKIMPLAIALAIGAGAAVPQAAWSQTPPPAQGQQAAPQPRPSRIEGRIAFLRAELHLTGAQAPLFEAVANAMRENDRTMRANFPGPQQRNAPVSLLDRLDQRQKRAEAMATATGKLRTAWAPLYASLTDDQKKTADELFMQRGHRMGRGRA